MKYGFLRVAAATPKTYVADCFKNIDEIIKQIFSQKKKEPQR